jgi:uncharacterized oligopeptide transporter (OPT) family protein
MSGVPQLLTLFTLYSGTFYFNFSPSYVGFGLISPHIVNCSVFLGSVISWGFLWPFISAQAGHWYPDNLSNSDFRGLYGYKVGSYFLDVQVNYYFRLR